MQKIFKVSLLAVLSSLAVNSFASTAEVKVLEPQLNYQQLLTQRQVVDELLEQAVKIQNSPARVSNAGFTAKLPSNMERIADLLLEAYKLEPYRVDFLFGAANANIYNGNTDKAIELYQKVLDVAPDDVKAHTYLAAWNRFKGNQAEATKHLDRLKQLSPESASKLEKVFAVIDKEQSWAPCRIPDLAVLPPVLKIGTAVNCSFTSNDNIFYIDTAYDCRKHIERVAFP